MAVRYDMPHMGGSTISTKLTAKLVNELRNGEYAQCERLPSEVNAAACVPVSRSVLRGVVSRLERAGFVERGRGIGTIIHRAVVNMSIRMDIKYEYHELVRGMGYTPSADHVRLSERLADDALAEKLELDAGAELIVCEKRILANGKPVIYSIDHLPKNLFQGMNYLQFDWSLPIFDILEEKCGILVDTDVAKLSATNGIAQVRQILELGEGEALILLDEVGYYKLSRPILQSYGFYTNFFDFTMLRKKF